MRIQIEAREIKEEQPIVKFWKLNIECASMFSEHSVRLFQEFFVVQYTGGQCLGIFGNALRVEFADLFRQVARITRRCGDGQSRVFRIDIDGRYVKLKTRMRLFEIKTADPLHIADNRHELEFHRNPSAPIA